MAKVTIISPAYNHEQFISQCIDSVLAQTFQDWEMIIVNDGSTDRTEEIIKRYRDSRIKYFYQENQGILRLGQTYNKILDMAQGRIAAVLECDDFWPSDKLASLTPAFDDPEVVVAYGFARLVAANGKKKNFTIPTLRHLNKFPRSYFNNEPLGIAACMMADFAVRTFTFPCATMIRISALKKIGGFQSVSGLPFIDYSTFMNLALQGKYRFIPKVTGYWRQHAASNTQTRNEDASNAILRQFALEFVKSRGISLPLSLISRSAIEKSWEYLSQDNARYLGRKLLLAKQWSAARGQFQQIIKSEKRFSEKIFGIIGYLSSWLHCDIEWVFSLAGRVTIKELSPAGKK
jgi:glycosyltransferase involved in cell wall biosynthesis